MIENKTEFGEALKTIRLGLDLTQVEVSKATNIPQTTITRFEKGAGTIDNLIKLVNYYSEYSPDFEIDLFSTTKPIYKKDKEQSLNFISVERLKDLRETINSEIKGIISQLNSKI